MPDHELEKLFGGFAADTLTADEQQRLYRAALQDQQLFNTLADEQAFKELLADPDVRRRLLRALQQAGPSTTGEARPWWAWFTKPAGLAWTGGLAAAVLAIAFGTRIYHESLDRAAQSVVTEEARSDRPSTQPAPPSMQAPRPAAPPEPKAKQEVEPANQDRRTGKLAKRERSVAGKLAEPPAPTSLADGAAPRPERDELRTPAPMGADEKESTQITHSADRKLAPPAPPPAAAPHPSATPPPLLQAPAGFSAARVPVPKKSARALFYGESSDRNGGQSKPFGLRYSFVTSGSGGRTEEITAAMAARSGEPVRITVEATQESYVQLLQNLGSAGTRLWWPPQETGKISLKLQAGKRSEIPMPPPAENGLITLIIRLSSKPFGPLTMQEVGMLDRFSANLLVETVSPGQVAGVEEQATYVVSQDPSTSAQLAVEVPVAR